MIVLPVILAIAILLVLYLRWVRPWQLRWGATDREVSRPMPGDEIVVKPSFNATRAVTIHAPASHIYPWIRQIGMNRAGWYSYDLLDNLGRPSTRRILLEHQKTFVGQTIPISPDGKQGLFVKDFHDDEWILWWDQKGTTSWAWGIFPDGENRSRLVTRVRIRYQWFSPEFIFNLLIEFCDIIMMRKSMLGIKERAERLA